MSQNTEYWKKDELGNLLVGNYKVSSVAHEFSTPFYLYNSNVLLDKLNLIKQNFPSFNLLFALKANPNLAIAKLLVNNNVGVEIASAGELMFARAVGTPISRIAFTGHAKTTKEIAEYLQSGGEMIHVESKREIILVQEISEYLNPNLLTSVIIRVNLKDVTNTAHEKMAGSPSQFGIDEEALLQTLLSLKSPRLRYTGFHAYYGSQNLNEQSIINHFGKVANLSVQVSESLGFPLEIVNFGGGFGIPYGEGERTLDIATVGKKAEAIVSKKFASLCSSPKLYLELGRYLVGECGIFVTKIVGLKSSRGKNFVIVDSGINGFSRPIMPWATSHTCSLASKLNERKTNTYTIVGPLCQPSDVLSEDVELADPMPGDLVVFYNAGAYGYTMSLNLYLTQKTPKEVLFFRDRFYLVRSEIMPEQIMQAQKIPEALIDGDT